jgi:AAA domain (dynein-related subfamily)
VKNANTYRYGTKQRVIAELVERGLTRREVFAELKPLVTNQTRPMIFTRNSPAGRVPLEIDSQYSRLWFQIGRVMHQMTGIKDNDEPMPDDDSPIEEPKTEPKPEPATEDAEDYFLRRVREVRKFCADRAEIGEAIDEISIRPARDGIRAIRAGISADAMLNAMTLHWPSDTRREAGITPCDWKAEAAKLNKHYKLGEGYHHMTGLVIALAEARVPIMLVGPAGSGKSHVCKQVADYLEFQYAECPMTAGATPSWLLGNIQLPTPSSPEGYRARPFLERFESGGVFNFEEIDAADPNMLLVSNQALAAEEFFNPVNGEMYEKSENFIAMSTANTFGLGATRAFTARERLDAATIDRWRMGRVFVDIDEDLVDWIAKNQ